MNSSFTSPSKTLTKLSLLGSSLTPLLGYFLALAAMGMMGAVFGPTLPNLAENTHASLGLLSLLFTAKSLGVVVSSLPGGWLLDRLPAHALMGAALLSTSLLMFLVPLASSAVLLISLTLLLGLGEGILSIGSNTLLIWQLRGRSSPYLNGLHFFFGLGALLSPFIVAQLFARDLDFRWAFWLPAALILPASLWFFNRPAPRPVHLRTENKPTRITSKALVGLAAVFLLLYVAAEVSFGSWAFTYAVQANLAKPASAAYLTSLFWGALTFGRLLGVPLTTRLSSRKLLAFDLIGILSSLVLMIAFPDSRVALWIGAFGLGLFMASIFPTTFALVEESLHITSRITGWFMLGASLGAMTLPWLIGQGIERFGHAVILPAILADVLLAAGLFMLIILLTRQPLRRGEITNA